MTRPPLALLLVSADTARLRAALTFARAEIAVGGTAHLFLQGEAAALLRPPVSDPRDAAWVAAGDPTLATLLDEALDDGARISLCQSGLALVGMTADQLDRRIELTGPVAFLAEVGPDMRLLAL
ncbi:MAG TPA: DsrE family protein [Sphingobium sp.]|nr:DsrE family protein [Sphingobium sp.]